jgi:hypothetical protein
MASKGHGIAVRRTAAGVVVVCALLFFAPRVGERDRDEARAIGWIRPVQHWQQIHARAHDGAYATMECLTDPRCAPEVHREGPPPGPDFGATSERDGYRFQFHAGPLLRARSDERPSRTAMTHFAVVAVPVEPSPRKRAFCGDDRGDIYYTMGGAVPRVKAGRCLDTWHTVH